jgi:purine-binding chemotaxis protein CheW
VVRERGHIPAQSWRVCALWPLISAPTPPLAAIARRRQLVPRRSGLGCRAAGASSPPVLDGFRQRLAAAGSDFVGSTIYPNGIGRDKSVLKRVDTPSFLLRFLESAPDMNNMEDPRESTLNLLIFHASGLDCAFPLEAVREIVPMAQLSSPPGLPSGLLGFLDLRGTAIPIVRLDRLFDLAEQKPGLHTPMIILRGVLGAIGILVDSVRGILPAPIARLVDLPEDGTFQGCATAGLQLDGELIYLLSPVALLGAHEDRLLADYAAVSQARLLHMPEKNTQERQ